MAGAPAATDAPRPEASWSAVLSAVFPRISVASPLPRQILRAACFPTRVKFGNTAADEKKQEKRPQSTLPNAEAGEQIISSPWHLPMCSRRPHQRPLTTALHVAILLPLLPPAKFPLCLAASLSLSGSARLEPPIPEALAQAAQSVLDSLLSSVLYSLTSRCRHAAPKSSPPKT